RGQAQRPKARFFNSKQSLRIQRLKNDFELGCAASCNFHAAAELSCEHQINHPKVADKRPERMTERCGLVVFNQEVSSPREAVSDDRPQQRIPGTMSRNHG